MICWPVNWVSARQRYLSAPTVLQRLPVAEKKGLSGGIGYYDGQFDDARLAINMAQTAVEQGAVVINYMSVTGLVKDQKHIRGVEAMDMLDEQNIPTERKGCDQCNGCVC